ncbi:hypothetical protein VULLAG_LOCUS6621 [Vulpes lagopus]
MVIVFSKATML